jgi:hypothetical protein
MVCGFKESSALERFMGTGNNSTVRLGPITTLRIPPQTVIYGEFLDQHNINQGNLARVMRRLSYLS